MYVDGQTVPFGDSRLVAAVRVFVFCGYFLALRVDKARHRWAEGLRVSCYFAPFANLAKRLMGFAAYLSRKGS